MNLSDASNYDLLSCTVDGEYTPEQIKEAAEALEIEERHVLNPGPSGKIMDYLWNKYEEARGK